MILVAGGTGRLGSELVRQLVAGGRQVRVLTRDRTRAAHLVGVDVAVGDVRSAEDLLSAVSGVHAVVSAVHGFSAWGAGPASVDRDGNARLVDAAGGVGEPQRLAPSLGAAVSLGCPGALAAIRTGLLGVRVRLVDRAQRVPGHRRSVRAVDRSRA